MLPCRCPVVRKKTTFSVCLSVSLFFFFVTDFFLICFTFCFRLRLRGNRLSCACSNMNFLRWLWMTSVILDGEGRSTRGYTCTTETGEISDTERVMAAWETNWRRCVGQSVFSLAIALFLLQVGIVS